MDKILVIGSYNVGLTVFGPTIPRAGQTILGNSLHMTLCIWIFGFNRPCQSLDRGQVRFLDFFQGTAYLGIQLGFFNGLGGKTRKVEKQFQIIFSEAIPGGLGHIQDPDYFFLDLQWN